MKRRAKIFLGLLCGLAGLPLIVGCGGSDESATAAATSGTAGVSAQANTEAGGATASSQSTVIQDGAATQPAQCVTIFLDSLRNGDEQAANGVLTAKAREELAKTSYEMQPLGTPQGQFEIGRVGFPYEDKSVALVECVWTEPAMEGDEPITMEIVCEVHQDPVEWRIAGLAVTIPSTAETLVLDFENAAALQSTIDAATGQAPQSGPETNAVAQEPNAAAATQGMQATGSQGGQQQIPAQMVSGPQGLPSSYSAGDGQAPMQQSVPSQFPTSGSYQGNQLRPSQPAGQQVPNDSQNPNGAVNNGAVNSGAMNGGANSGSMPSYSGYSGSYPASSGQN